MINEKDGEQSPSYSPIEIEPISAVPAEKLEANIRSSVARGLPFFLDYEYELKNGPLAIVGGGPSLKHHLLDLQRFNAVMSVSTSHDYLIEHNIIPTFSVIADQVPEIESFQKKQQHTLYLLATQCDPIVFNHLSDCSIKLWDMDGWVDEKIFNGRGRIAGGSTAATRALSIAHVLGYRDLHLFGCDSSFEDGDHRHAYPGMDERDTRPVFECKINDKKFKTTLPMLQQAKDFQTLFTQYGFMFDVTVHGEGTLLHEAWADMKRKSDLVFTPEKMAW